MASNGLPLKIDYAVADLPPVDILFVSVGLTTEFPGKSKVLARPAQLGPARRRARRALGRLLSSGRGRPARGLPLHHPLGKPRRLHGALSRDRMHRQRLRDRPQALHLRRRHHLDRPDAGDRARRFRLRPRQRRRQPVPARAHPFGRRPPARRAGARPVGQVGKAAQDRRADGRQSRRALFGRPARQVCRPLGTPGRAAVPAPPLRDAGPLLHAAAGSSAPASCCARPTCRSSTSPSPPASPRIPISRRATACSSAVRRARSAARPIDGRDADPVPASSLASIRSLL